MKLKNKNQNILIRNPIQTLEKTKVSAISNIDSIRKTNNNRIIFKEKTEQQIPLDLPKKVHKNISKKQKKIFFIFILWILLFIFLISSFFFWNKLFDFKKDSAKINQIEINKIIKVIGKIMVLPIGETPKLITLTETDLNKTKTQLFFVKAKIGDKVLIYSLSKKVILYDPKINKIVEVANLVSDINN
ncbi:MAG: hypothetical protein V1910_00620 [bacterium]